VLSIRKVEDGFNISHPVVIFFLRNAGMVHISRLTSPSYILSDHIHSHFVVSDLLLTNFTDKWQLLGRYSELKPWS
jgi:hypothetical protein